MEGETYLQRVFACKDCYQRHIDDGYHSAENPGFEIVAAEPVLFSGVRVDEE